MGEVKSEIPFPPKEKARFSIGWDEAAQKLTFEGIITTKDELRFFSELIAKFMDRLPTPNEDIDHD